MNWSTHVRTEFARRGKQVDESVVEEMAQHTAAAFEEARAEGQSPDNAAAHVHALACGIPARRAAKVDPIEALRR